MGIRYQQPGYGVRPSVISDHLYNFIVSGAGSRNVNLTTVGAGKITGLGLYNDATNYAGYLGTSTGTFLDPRTGDFTLVFVFKLSVALGSGVNAYVVASDVGFNSTNHWWIYARGDGAGNHAIRGFIATSTGYNYKVGEQITVVYQRASGVGTMYIKGAGAIEVVTGADTNDYYNRTGNPVTFLGPTNTGGGYANVAGYAKAFDMSFGKYYDPKSLVNNPWQIFKTSSPLFKSASTGGTVYTLTASAGSYNVTGVSQNIYKSKLISGITGSYSVLGQSSNIYHNRSLVSNSGLYTVTGNSSNIVIDLTLGLLTGSYTITGHSATITYTPIAASYNLICNSGIYNVTGNTASIYKSNLISAVTGNYTVNGKPISITYSGAPSATGLLSYINVLNGEFCLFKQLN